MGVTTALFRQKQKELLGDISQTGALPTFTDQELDSWRNDEVGSLYGKGIYKVISTRGLAAYTEPTLAADVVTGWVPRYYPLPPLWRRVFAVEIIDPASDQLIDQVVRFDDLEVPGSIRIDDLDNSIGYTLRFRGEAEYTGVDDASAHQDVVDVVLFGSAMRALISEYMKRIKVKQVTRGNDRQSSLVTWHMSSAIAQLRTLHRDAKAAALNSQRAVTVSINPAGRVRF